MQVFQAGKFRRLVVARAPAGFGKSVQLQHWFEDAFARAGQAAWLTLDAGDNASERFLHALVDAIRYVRPGFGAALLTLLELNAKPGPRDAATLLINELAVRPEPLHVFLDEFHCIESSFVGEFLEFFLRHVPETIQVIVACRGELNFDYSYLRLSDSVLELSGQHFAFSASESADLLSARTNILHLPNISELTRCAQGWVAILQLLTQQPAAAATPAYASESALDSNALSEFFQRDVLAKVPSGDVALLAKASLFPQFNAALCDATLGVGSGDLIQGLIRRYGLPFFKVIDSDSWYRCHHVFADFMRLEVLRSSKDVIAKLHQSASKWLATSGRPSEAIAEALLAGDSVSAADILDRAADTLSRTGQIDKFLSYLADIPTEVLRLYPQLRLRHVWALTLVWNFREARRLLADIREQRTAAQPSASFSDREFEAQLLRREMTIELVADNLLPARTLGNHLLSVYPPADPEERRAIEMEVFYSSQNMFDCSSLDVAWALAENLRANPAERYASVWTDCVVANAEWLRGSIDEAQALCQSAIATAEQNNRADRAAALAAMPTALLAEICYERNALADARRLALDAIPYLAEAGLLDPAIAGYLSMARLHFIDGDFKQADAVLSRANQLAVNRGFTRLQACLLAERIRLALHRGRVEEALRLARSGALLCPPDAVLPQSNPTIEQLTRALIWARVACAQGHYASALLVLRRWQRVATAATYDLLVARIAIQIALALNLQGDPLAAKRQIKLALETGEPAGLLRSFLDEGEPVRRLIQEVCERHTHKPDPLAAYGERILETFQLERPSTPLASPGTDIDNVDLPTEPLTERQLDILRLVSSGLSNRDVAADLGLSEGTVKWYLHDAFVRLGVRRRSHAIRRAYQLGFLR